MNETDPSSVPKSSEPRILVVDDEPTLRLSFGFALQTDGYSVEQAADGDLALEWLRETENGFDAMLLDLRMPGKSGLDVLRELRSEERFIPTVIVSAYIDSPTAVEAVEFGVTDFLKKPVTPDDLRGALAKLIAEEKGDGGAPVSIARKHLRRGDIEGACAALEGIDSGGNPEATFWKMLAEHLRLCRESTEGAKTEFASSRFYQAADVLGMLAFNA